MLTAAPFTDRNSHHSWQAHLRRLGCKHKQTEVEFPAETYFLKTADSQITASTHSTADNSDFPLRVAPSSSLNPVNPQINLRSEGS